MSPPRWRRHCPRATWCCSRTPPGSCSRASSCARWMPTRSSACSHIPTSAGACAPSCAPRAPRSPRACSACTSPPGRARARSPRSSKAAPSPPRSTPDRTPPTPPRRTMSDTPVVTPELPAFADDEVGLLAPLYPLPRLELVEGRGARVRDAGGREYLDFTSGIAVNAFGHAPRGLAETLAAQLARLGHCSNLFANEPALELARELTEATGFPRVFFCNSGTEGMDAALKFARARARALGMPGRDILAFKGGFHWC